MVSLGVGVGRGANGLKLLSQGGLGETKGRENDDERNKEGMGCHWMKPRSFRHRAALEDMLRIPGFLIFHDYKDYFGL